MSPSPVYNLIKRARTYLNGLIVVSMMLKSLAWMGFISGTLLIVAKMARLSWGNWKVWLVLSLAGCLAGCGIAMARRLGMIEAARWLDNRLESGEVFSAALVCINRPKSGPFDDAILLRADDWTGRSNIPWPWRHMLRWLTAALGMLVVISLLFAAQLPRIQIFHQLTANHGQLLAEDGLSPSGKPKGHSDAQSPRALAEKLFPQNHQLARKMEEALRKGDAFELERLFKEAEWDTDNMIDREIASAEPGKVETQKQRMEREMLAMARENGENASKETDGSMSGNGKTGREDGGKHKTLARTGNSSKNQQKVQDGSNGNDEIPAERQSNEGRGKEHKSHQSEQGNRGKGQQAGKGKGNVNKYWGDLTGSTTQTKAIITQRKDGPMLEYVLPGKKIRAPLTEAVPHAQRSAEAAMTKQEVPGEYEAFVRSYFLKLTQKSSGGSKKEGHS